MKKLLTLLFAFLVAFSMAMPVFAQDSSAAASTETKTKKHKATKTKKAKAPKTTAAPAQ